MTDSNTVVLPCLIDGKPERKEFVSQKNAIVMLGLKPTNREGITRRTVGVWARTVGRKKYYFLDDIVYISQIDWGDPRPPDRNAELDLVSIGEAAAMIPSSHRSRTHITERSVKNLMTNNALSHVIVGGDRIPIKSEVIRYAAARRV